ncbi:MULTISPECIES: AraC family transcriptional regulator [unclassified Herbaspirillum]|uniref:AraC family transcriptional regulator n=1 Tax=unclassified Herbaspirillum TaxID=2624150 RepID=UPI00115469D3|nr:MULTISPECIES: AraC family transcriptional regulator [unclassified Herbaspirillum]MBB5391519.1 AraC-like DNA-binding protein [Herbaspirillum sp. SJZ102]TQK12798.1 AraC family transcriptional regulator [Herbaspirillum sp. SJZ130]TQK14802.1 AraC family transcriptional regulator [Herbaspirillum sp. SJZ106]
MADKDIPDTLTDILLGLRLDGVEYGRCVTHEPWAVAFPPRPEATFHFIAQGNCWMRTQTTDWMPLHAGDALLLPRSTFHVMASSPEVPSVDIDTLARKVLSENLYLVNDVGHSSSCARDARAAAAVESAALEAEPSHILFTGTMRFNLDPLHPLLAMMPDVMRARDLQQSDPAVLSMLEAMEREVTLNRIGACGILARLADVLAASIIRAWVECACSDATGWIAAVRCPQVGRVLAAVHRQPEREWSVAELADVMGTSRSSFIEKFSSTVGETPAKYVARVKMFQARHWIAREGMRVAVVANRLGYDSEASFSRAFKRIIGHPPSEARFG